MNVYDVKYRQYLFVVYHIKILQYTSQDVANTYLWFLGTG